MIDRCEPLLNTRWLPVLGSQVRVKETGLLGEVQKIEGSDGSRRFVLDHYVPPADIEADDWDLVGEAREANEAQCTYTVDELARWYP